MLVGHQNAAPKAIHDENKKDGKIENRLDMGQVQLHYIA